MIAADLLMELGRRGIRLEVDGERLRYHPRSALTPELLVELRQNKTELLSLLAPAEVRSQDVARTDSFDANEFYWHQITEADRRYLLGPRCYPDPCMWCGGRLVHNSHCDELRLSLEPVTPFGRHAGKKRPEVTHAYLSRPSRQICVDTKLRAATQQPLTFSNSETSRNPH